MNRALRAEAMRYPGQEAKLIEFFRKNPQAAENLRGPIFEDKVVDFVLGQVKVTEQVVSPEELAKDPGGAAEKEPGAGSAAAEDTEGGSPSDVEPA
jgi:trigger factor